MTAVLGTVAAVFVLTSIALRALGYQAALPLSFLPFLAVACLPLAVAVVCGAALVPRRHRWPEPGWAARVGCMAAGVALTYWLHQPVLWLIVAVALLIHTRSSWTRPVLGKLGLAIAAMTVGYASVWNANYLAAAIVGERRIDDALLALDRTLLPALIPSLNAEALFPLVTQPQAFRLLEHAYLMLFPQVLIGLMLVVMYTSSRAAARWLTVLFAAYGVGLVCFVLLPSVGPPIHAPGTFQPELSGTFTAHLMRLMADEFRHFHAGEPLSGFGYFVALPSLHVAIAVLVQASLRSAPFLFWTWLPITVLLSLSTVVLGYHYVVDLPAGLMLGFGLARLLPGLNTVGAAPVGQLEPSGRELWT